MTVHPSAKNLAKSALRRPKRPQGFPKKVKDIMGTRSGGMCEIDNCGPIFEWHHRGPRALGGTSAPWVNRAANGLGLASRCHRRVESNRAKAYENGWLVRRNGSQTAAEVPVLYRGRWVLLTDDGGVNPIGAEA